MRGICPAEFIGGGDDGERREEIKYIKCVIPKGSTYYVGTFDYWKSYASDKLTYVEIID